MDTIATTDNTIKLMFYLTLFAIFAASSASNITLYINNTANLSNPDGTQANPYNSFSQALENNLIQSIQTDNITLMFVPTETAYPIEIPSNTFADGINISSLT